MNYSYWSVAQVAQECQVTVDRVRADLRQGKLKAHRPGREYLFDVPQLRAARAFYARLQSVREQAG